MKIFMTIAALSITSLAACGVDQHNSRTESKAVESPAPATDDLNLSSVSSTAPLVELMNKVAAFVKKSKANGSNVYVVGIDYANVSSAGKTRCTFVQAQERQLGKLVVKQGFVPAGQSPDCKIKMGAGFTGGSFGIMASLNNGMWAAGVAGGVIGYTPMGNGYAGACGIAGSVVSDGVGGVYPAYSGPYCSYIYDLTTFQPI